MSRSNFVIAPFKVSPKKSCMVMINNDDIHFLDHNGQEIDREKLDLPSVFVLSFQDGEDRSYTLAKEGEEYENVNLYDNLYVINKDNKVIYSTRNGEFKTFCRIADDSIIIGVKEIVKTADILTCKNKSGILVANNKLTNHGYVGAIDNYYLFAEDTNCYHLYELSSNDVPCEHISLNHVLSFNADFFTLWKMSEVCGINVFYFNKERPNTFVAESVSADSCKKKEFHIESGLRTGNWEENMQILHDDNSIVFHHCNTSSYYKGFTIIIEYKEHKDELVLSNQKRLGKYYNDSIELYSNSLILIKDNYESIVYNINGELVAKVQNRLKEKYAIFENKISSLRVCSSIKNNSSRYGVIRLSDLQMIVPPNFNKIDYVVIEELNYTAYGKKVELKDIYIKASIECIGKNGEPIEYWGLFKDSKLVLPVSCMSIENLHVENYAILMIENTEGLKGILYNDNILVPCAYKKIEVFGYYLIMEKPNGKIDICYYYHSSILLKGFSSVLPVKINKNSGSNTFKSVIIVEKKGKYGIVSNGKLVLKCVYDEIKLIHFFPNYSITYGGKGLPAICPQWFSFRIGNKFGVYGNCENSGEGFISKLIYSDVKVIHCGDQGKYVLQLDNIIYSIKEKEKRICENDKLSFRGFISSDVLAFSDENGEILELYDYRGKKQEFKIIYIDSEGVIDEKNLDMNLEPQYLKKYKYAFEAGFSATGYCDYELQEYIFSFEKNVIIPNPVFYTEEDNDDDVYDDPYEDLFNPERDTYYALGGDDYDAFKENGGSIDDMMDGMGF